jgi:hypothetical protein
MKYALVYCLFCSTCFCNTNNILSPTNYPYLNQYDILNNYTETNYRLKKNNIILTGQFLKDNALNRITSFTTIKIEF